MTFQAPSGRAWLRSIALLTALLAAACGDGTTGSDGGASDAGARDAGLDAAVAEDGGAGEDAGTEDAATAEDAGAEDAGAEDAGGSLDGGASDAGIDAGGADAGPLSACASAGGACVPVVPGACSSGVVGDADWYSCGGGLGVQCCLPTTTPPECRAIGTRSEGWYRPDGSRVCYATCAGRGATCEAIGTRSEGWYTDDASAGCTAIPVDRLIEWAMCAP